MCIFGLDLASLTSISGWAPSRQSGASGSPAGCYSWCRHPLAFVPTRQTPCLVALLLTASTSAGHVKRLCSASLRTVDRPLAGAVVVRHSVGMGDLEQLHFLAELAADDVEIHQYLLAHLDDGLLR